ncbi:LANO_0D00672g1_1 [Lachancea nothofagi CBS 11611]|uniref:Decapping nuclease n=1 Tax=Lachancea nothofagi CBS 11611 TaxID=1266666 RepID=A0A1G4JD20_9SACH|nr:LANO_0D00672g1_1 [Lachancea nothofagi CBS 11611]
MGLSSNLFVQKRSSTNSLRQPKELGHYSKTQDNEFLINDNAKMSYYYLPDTELNKNLDLCGGIKKFKECSAKSEFDACTLSGLLKTVQAYEQRKNKKVSADIITFRGVMRKLISSAFDSPKFNHVELRVVSFNGQLFIKEVSQAHPPPSNSDSMEYRSYYSGYKFETLSTISKPLAQVSRSSLEKRHKKICNNGDQYITVVRSGVGSCKLVLGAEVDCVFDFCEDSTDNLKHYAELKCTKGVSTIADARRFERKVFKTWLQCFLIGINRIIYGFRDDNFLLKSVEEYSTQEIPLLLKNNNPQLTNACMDAVRWYGALTEWLLATIPREESTEYLKAYRLSFENNHLKLSEIEEGHEEYPELLDGENVLSHEFRAWRKELATMAAKK